MSKLNSTLTADKSKYVERFAALYAGLDRAYGVSKVKGRTTAGEKVEASCRTVIEPVTLALYEKHLRGDTGLGIVPIDDAGTSSFGAIDIDEYDGLDHGALVKKLAEKNLPGVVCKSKSGGAHVYFFFSSGVSSAALRVSLQAIAAAMGWPGVEIFPKQAALSSSADSGNWINLPYFGDDRLALGADGQELSLAEFLDYAATRMTDDLDDLGLSLPKATAYADGPPCLQQLSVAGVPKGARNNALLSMGVYAQKKYPEDWREVLDAYNRDHMAEPMPSSEVAAITKSLEKKQYGYKCSDQPLVDVCQSSVCLSRKYGIQPGSGDGAGVQIESISMLNTDPPIWFVQVENARVEVSTDELFDQHRFRKKVYEKTRIMPTRMKVAKWEDMIRAKDVKLIDAPPEASPKGRLLELFNEWLTVHPVGAQRSELLLGKPTRVKEYPGWVYFRSGDFEKFLVRQSFNEVKRNERWPVLEANGVERVLQFKVQGQNTSVWRVPLPENTAGELPAMDVAGDAEF
jgi:hypothetical protein